MRSLVVDDEDDARELLKSSLMRYGAEVVTASSAAEAFDLITTAPASERPEVMLTDLGMPGEGRWLQFDTTLARVGARAGRLYPGGGAYGVRRSRRPDASLNGRLPNAHRQAGRAC